MVLILLLCFAAASYNLFLAVAVLLQNTGSRAHRLFALGMCAFAAEMTIVGLSFLAESPAALLDWHRRQLVALSFVPGLWLLFSLTFARGNAAEFLKGWRLIWMPLLAVPPLGVLLTYSSLVPRILVAEDSFWKVELSTTGQVLHGIILLTSITIVMNLEKTFRAAVGTMRWQIKYMVIGVGLAFAVRLYTNSQSLLFSATDYTLQGVNATGLLLGCLLITRSLFRSEWFKVDVYPSHRILHGSFTLMLAGVYLLVVGLFAKWVAIIGSETAFPLKSFFILVSLAGLGVLLLSDRFHETVRRWISTHFHRPRYDYRKLWTSFTEATSHTIEENDLCQASARMISQTFDALSVTIWLFTNEWDRLHLAGSTSTISSPNSSSEKLTPEKVQELAQALEKEEKPVNIDTREASWIHAVRQCHAVYFDNGGHRWCLPIRANGQVIGILALGDRVNGLPFNDEELDVLRCLVDQLGAALQNRRLSRDLVQAKELEAFQAMSAFFVHDLKNTASTLSLMLQNLPKRFDDPEFRKDALRSIGKSVEHIHSLISRLSVLRKKLELNRAPTELNQVVLGVLQQLDASPTIQLHHDLQPMPPIAIDASQMEKVITNLVLNAKEAVGNSGEITISTRKENDYAILKVSDNGCGMTQEFIDRSLFRPFQTTKKKGTGIGMFHTRMIVQAHQGRIAVESSPGQGTTFSVQLPYEPQRAGSGSQQSNANSQQPSGNLPSPQEITNQTSKHETENA